MEGTTNTPLLTGGDRRAQRQQRQSRRHTQNPRAARTAANQSNGAQPQSQQSNTWTITLGDTRDHYKPINLAAVTVFSTIGSLLFGFDFGVFPWMVADIEDTYNSSTAWSYLLDHKALMTGLLALSVLGTAGLTTLCIMVVAGMGWNPSTRTELLVSSALLSVGSLLEAESQELGVSSNDGLIMLFIGRIIFGCGSGLTLHATPMYLAEVAPTRLRGMVCGWIEFSLTIGIVLGYAIGEAFHNAGLGWRYTFKFATVFALVKLLAMFSLPESPRFLLVAGRPLADALEAFHFVNPSVTREDVAQLKREITRQTPDNAGRPFARMTSGELRFQVFIGLGVMILSSASGQLALLYYLRSAMRTLTESSTDATIAVASFGVCKLLGVAVGIRTSDVIGRRTPLLIGLCLSSLAALSLSILYGAGIDDDMSVSWLFILLLDLTAMFFSGSIAALSWILLGELFPMAVKSTVVALSITVYTFITALMSFVIGYETKSGSTGWSVFWAQVAVVCFCSFLFSGYLVPRSKGKSLEEVQKLIFRQDYETDDQEAGNQGVDVNVSNYVMHNIRA